MNEEAQGAASTPIGRRAGDRWARRTPYGIRRAGLIAMMRVCVLTRPPTPPTRRSISAPTIAVCSSPGRQRDGFRVIDAFSRIIRLGEGIAKSGRISEAAIARAIDALLICRDKMRARGVTRARLIATEACRAAAERRSIPRPRRRGKQGLELEIIDSATEARLAASGLHGTRRSRGRGRHPVRHRRRVVGTGAARPKERRPPRAAATRHRRLGRRCRRRCRDARRALRRHRGPAVVYDAMVAVEVAPPPRTSPPRTAWI